MDFADISAARKLVDDRTALLQSFLEKFAEELVPIQDASFAGKVDYIYGEKIRHNGVNYQLNEGLIDTAWRNVLLDLQERFGD